ncbi:MAG: BlaI/MecI/CopY family transcriptional regulator [Phycisphaeraceae bacterium]|nr:BlaI/MecI/CopY family transcriptional regulator [Phycisphaerales bacterium]QOJ17146.1 MAG: BlaI/MecI/CopY family transcriptional regulator [Phycisphaeraceae bacterium]
MPDHPAINDTEWDILSELWTVERATARELADRLRASRGWAYSTVKTMLDRMVKKGLVHARQVGNVWEYTPAVQPDTARRGAWRRFVDAAFGGAMAPALEFIATDARLTRSQREKLRRLLDEGASTSARDRLGDQQP